MIERRLLIMSCSKSKVATPGSMPAARRYNGIMYKALRKAARQDPKSIRKLDLWILSAKFGLIRYDRPIGWYELKMTKQLAEKHASNVQDIYRKILKTGEYDKICFAMSKLYLSTFGDYHKPVPFLTSIHVCDGNIYYKPGQLYKWLLDYNEYGTFKPIP